jgi:hypothetical protein
MPLEFVVSKKSKVSVLQSIGIREFQSSEKYHRRSKTTNYSGKKKRDEQSHQPVKFREQFHL